MGEIRDNISANIARYRKEKGISQKELAEKVGAKNLTTVSSWERGASSPDIETLFIMCDIFGVSINEMYGIEKNISKKESPTLSTEHQEVLSAYDNADLHDKNLARMALRLPTLKEDTEFGEDTNFKTS